MVARLHPYACNAAHPGYRLSLSPRTIVNLGDGGEGKERGLNLFGIAVRYLEQLYLALVHTTTRRRVPPPRRRRRRRRLTSFRLSPMLTSADATMWISMSVKRVQFSPPSFFSLHAKQHEESGFIFE